MRRSGKQCLMFISLFKNKIDLFILSPMGTLCSDLLIILDFITPTLCGVEYKL
jgi:hypothetical protein